MLSDGSYARERLKTKTAVSSQGLLLQNVRIGAA
jgi:hypothetical protein